MFTVNKALNTHPLVKEWVLTFLFTVVHEEWGLVLFIVGILIFHYNSKLGFLFLLFSRPAEGIKALVPEFFTPIGAVVLVLSGFFYRRRARR